MLNESRPTRDSLSSAFPSNSDKSKRESQEKKRTKLTPVVKTAPKKVKKTFGQKLKEAFFGDDEVTSVGDYVLKDVLVPALKNTLSDMVGGGIEMLLFGERRSRVLTRDRGRGYTNYDGYYRREEPRSTRDTRDDRRDFSRVSRTRHSFDEILYDTMEEAEDVLSGLVEQTLQYGTATVAELYELSKIDSTSADVNYGWTSLKGAYPDPVRNGYVLRLPPPRFLD